MSKFVIKIKDKKYTLENVSNALEAKRIAERMYLKDKELDLDKMLKEINSAKSTLLNASLIIPELRKNNPKFSVKDIEVTINLVEDNMKYLRSLIK